VKKEMASRVEHAKSVLERTNGFACKIFSCLPRGAKVVRILNIVSGFFILYFLMLLSGLLDNESLMMTSPDRKRQS